MQWADVFMRRPLIRECARVSACVRACVFVFVCECVRVCVLVWKPQGDRYTGFKVGRDLKQINISQWLNNRKPDKSHIEWTPFLISSAITDIWLYYPPILTCYLKEGLYFIWRSQEYLLTTVMTILLIVKLALWGTFISFSMDYFTELNRLDSLII